MELKVLKAFEGRETERWCPKFNDVWKRKLRKGKVERVLEYGEEKEIDGIEGVKTF